MNALPSGALASFMEQSQQRVNNTLADCLESATPSERLNKAIQYACLTGGKRLRPILVYASNLAVGGNLEEANDAAAAVELIHSYSLVHDDLPAMDDDDLRRGEPTVHKAFDEATAILVGDALQSMAFALLSNPAPDKDIQLQLQSIALLAEASGGNGMVGGQAIDFEAVGKNLSIQELETMHRLKTGALIRASVRLGALSHPGGDEHDLAALESYADHVGLAFQVQDDILDETSDTQTLGKPQGSDRKLNKPTYVSLLGLDQARCHALELADKAVAQLKGLGDNANYLRELAQFVVGRQH